MIRYLRRQLRLIHYYSATRDRTAWTVAAEWALLASILLAVPAMLLAERIVRRAETAEEVTGAISGKPNGPFTVILDQPDARFAHSRWDPYGDFDLTVADVHCGWPFTSAVERRPATLDLNVYVEQTVRRNARLDADDPLRVTIERALSENGETAMLGAWREERWPQLRRHYRGSVGGTLVWWMMLSFVSVAGLHVIRFATIAMSVRRENIKTGRIARGRCPNCGYDMRGLEFNDRCPECGALVH